MNNRAKGDLLYAVAAAGMLGTVNCALNWPIKTATFEYGKYDLESGRVNQFEGLLSTLFCP